jgi:ribosomal protein L44E
MKIIVSKEDKKYIEESIKSGEVLKEDLRRWFKEKWVDVSKKVDGKYPPCGRKDADGKSYPKCRPSKKVSKETPKIASSYSKKEKKSMTSQKRSAEKKNPKVGKGNKPTMTHFDESEKKDKKIVCDNCGWSWKLSDGGEDPYTCHKCGCNNAKKYKKMKLKITETQYIRIFEEGPVEDTEFVSNDVLTEAEYQGRKVQLGKIMQGDIKKFKVYVKNDKGKVVKVNFGFGGKSAHGKRMVIKKNNPKRRKSFRARMGCDSPGPRWKPRYWACRTW